MAEPFDLEPARLLEAYRVEAGPPPDAEARMLGSLHAQLGAASLGGGSGAGGGSGGASSASTGLGVGGLKLVVGVGLSLALGAAWVALTRDPAPAPAPMIEAAASSVSPSSIEPVLGPAPERSLEPAGASALTLEDEADTDTDTDEARLPASPEPKPALRTPSESGSRRGSRAKRLDPPKLADEAKLLREADEALRRGAITEAQTALETHEQRFGEGALAGQARVLELLLACVRDAPHAQRQAAAHLQRHPDELARARLIDQCSLDD